MLKPRWWSVGWFFVLVEIYLAIAARLLAYDVLIAPPVLVFLAVDRWIAITIVVVLVCAIELAIRRNIGSAIAVVMALVVAATGPFRFQ